MSPRKALKMPSEKDTAKITQMLERANFVLNTVGLAMETNDNLCGKGFKNIINIKTKEVLGQQPISINNDIIEFEQSIIRWLANHKFNSGFLFHKQNMSNKEK
jgi:hypothetical protein